MRYDDPDVTVSAVVGIIGVVVLFVSIVLLQALFFHMQEGEMERKVYRQTNEELRSIDAQQMETLNSYGWIDETGGVTHIPIAEAMELVVLEQGGQ